MLTHLLGFLESFLPRLLFLHLFEELDTLSLILLQLEYLIRCEVLAIDTGGFITEVAEYATPVLPVSIVSDLIELE